MPGKSWHPSLRQHNQEKTSSPQFLRPHNDVMLQVGNPFVKFSKMAAYEPAISSIRDSNSPMLNLPVENRGLVLRPLVFPEDSDVGLDYGLVDPRLDVPLFCLACESQFNEPLTAKDNLLEHLLVKHKIVIGKVNLVCGMKR